MGLEGPPGGKWTKKGVRSLQNLYQTLVLEWIGRGILGKTKDKKNMWSPTQNQYQTLIQICSHIWSTISPGIPAGLWLGSYLFSGGSDNTTKQIISRSSSSQREQVKSGHFVNPFCKPKTARVRDKLSVDPNWSSTLLTMNSWSLTAGLLLWPAVSQQSKAGNRADNV